MVTALLNSDETPPDVPQAKALKRYWTRLSISSKIPNLIMLDTNRIFVPNNTIKYILKQLHAGHPGKTKARELARQLYYWPGMNNDIGQVIDACQACQEVRPAQANFPAKPNPPSTYSTYPMQAVGTDLFSLYGEDWIVLVDRYSGYLCAEKLRRTDTESVIKQLTYWFQLLGWPETIRSDGGPQYRNCLLYTSPSPRDRG